MAQDILDIILYCGTFLGRVGSDFFSAEYSVGGRAVSYKAGDMALSLLKKERT